MVADNPVQELEKGLKGMLESGYSEPGTSQVQHEMGPYSFTKKQYNHILALLKGKGNVGVKPDITISASLSGSLKWKVKEDW